MNIELNLNDPNLVTIMGNSPDGARYALNGIRYKGDGSVIGDKVKIIADIKKQQMVEAEKELNRRKAELAEYEKTIPVEVAPEAPTAPKAPATPKAPTTPKV